METDPLSVTENFGFKYHDSQGIALADRSTMAKVPVLVALRLNGGSEWEEERRREGWMWRPGMGLNWGEAL
jgi:hypothetical protein